MPEVEADEGAEGANVRAMGKHLDEQLPAPSRAFRSAGGPIGPSTSPCQRAAARHQVAQHTRRTHGRSRRATRRRPTRRRRPPIRSRTSGLDGSRKGEDMGAGTRRARSEPRWSGSNDRRTLPRGCSRNGERPRPGQCANDSTSARQREREEDMAGTPIYQNTEPTGTAGWRKADGTVVVDSSNPKVREAVERIAKERAVAPRRLRHRRLRPRNHSSPQVPRPQRCPRPRPRPPARRRQTCPPHR